jgi:hypothetical protein
VNLSQNLAYSAKVRLASSIDANKVWFTIRDDIIRSDDEIPSNDYTGQEVWVHCKLRAAVMFLDFVYLGW